MENAERAGRPWVLGMQWQSRGCVKRHQIPPRTGGPTKKCESSQVMGSSATWAGCSAKWGRAFVYDVSSVYHYSTMRPIIASSKNPSRTHGWRVSGCEFRSRRERHIRTRTDARTAARAVVPCSGPEETSQKLSPKVSWFLAHGKASSL